MPHKAPKRGSKYGRASPETGTGTVNRMKHEKILIVNLGGSYAFALARRLRGCSVYCEVAPASISPEQVTELSPRGLILAGSGKADQLQAAVLGLGLPALGMGGGALGLVNALGGRVGEIAFTHDTMPLAMEDSPLLHDVPDCERYFERMYRMRLPEGFAVIAGNEEYPAAFACEEKRLYGMQFDVESNDPEGMEILINFAVRICGCSEDWSMPAFVEAECRRIQEKVGSGTALMAMSGGVDSSVCAAIMNLAIGGNMRYLYVDTGLMRKGDTEMMKRTFAQDMGLNLVCVDASERFLQVLRGVTDPQEKWRVTNRLFDQIFHEEAEKMGHTDFLVQGTIYPDVLESDHPLLMPEEEGVVEPVRRLFKEETRALGECLGLPEQIIHRQSFPGAGLAIRTLGEVTQEKLTILREADAIYREELVAARLDKRIQNYFAVLEESTSTGERACRYTVALRAVNRSGGSYAAYRMPYDLLERVSERIMGEVPGVNRVVYDMTATGHAPIEWE